MTLQIVALNVRRAFIKIHERHDFFLSKIKGSDGYPFTDPLKKKKRRRSYVSPCESFTPMKILWGRFYFNSNFLHPPTFYRRATCFPLSE